MKIPKFISRKFIYMAKPDAWFKEGTVCIKVDDFGISGIYEGIYVVGSRGIDNEKPKGEAGYDNYWYEKGYVDGDEVVMREHCTDDEFFRSIEAIHSPDCKYHSDWHACDCGAFDE